MKRWSLLLTIIFLASCNLDKTASGAFIQMDSLDSTELITYNSSSNNGVSPDNAVTATASSSLGTETDNLFTDSGGLGYTVNSSDILDSSVVLNPANEDLTNDNRIAQFQVNAAYITSCVGTGVISNITCSLAGFFVDLSDVFHNATKSQNLRIEGSTSNNKIVDSAPYIAKLYSVLKVTNNGSALDDVQNLVVYKSKLYFMARDVNGILHVYSYDGTKVKLFSTLAGGDPDNMNPLVVFNNKLILNGVTAEAGSPERIFTYDGTALNQVSDINISGIGQDIILVSYGLPLEFGGKLFFLLNDTTADMYSFDGTNFQKITNLPALPGPQFPVPVAATSNYMYFALSDGLHEVLYQMNPNAALRQFTRITDNTFTISTNIDSYFVLNDKLYFSGIISGDSQPSTFAINEDTGKIDRVSDPTTGVMFNKVVVQNGVAYGVVPPVGSRTVNSLFKFDGDTFRRITGDSCDVENHNNATTLYATSNGVYVNCTGSTTGLYRYHNYKFQKIIDDYGDIAGSTSISSTIVLNGELYFVPSGGTDTSLYRIKLLE